MARLSFHGPCHPMKKNVWRGTVVASVNWAPFRYLLEMKMTHGKPYLSFARISVWSLQSSAPIKISFITWPKSKRSKGPTAECNNQLSPELIRCLSAYSPAEHELLSTCKIFRMRLNMKNVDITMTTSNSLWWSKTHCCPDVCCSALENVFHTFQHVKNTPRCQL